ncbi:hypothetical protein [Noviherbaspirillum sp. UKPF54]|uniref:hypothetical protein n=1 Tax=Noviherbaspirillum sp. UKPF54 TaxID=2601898 RepID=UPI0011B1744F|nr:hypothetical protein [Noviherbaspirillum sp. UKPF54]QDZ27899.1 hypothetical protein FAY22_08015 [Noviherbaspirillum sp. UKPF54]
MLKPGLAPRLFIAVAACCIFPATAQETGAAKNENLTAPIIPPLFIIAPTEVRTDPTLAKGCWVRLFPQPDYQGLDDLTVAGPVELPSLHTPAGGVYWKHKTESVIVGPKATVAVYENEHYRHQTAKLTPGTREPQLRKGLKFTQSIDSLKITCAK